jgi:DNA-directed RNA polymerase subunit RPC12/RpoP
LSITIEAMQIKFKCPNGHQLSASKDRVGKPGKCPKCGTKFVVPEASEEDAGKSSKDKPTEATFAFLCPNGHELNGPISLRGRPGQCPHCGEKFLVPEEDAADDETSTDAAGPTQDETPPEVFPTEPSAEQEEVLVGMIVEVPPEEVLLHDDEDIPTGELEIDEELTLEDDDEFQAQQSKSSGSMRKPSGITTKLEHQSLLELIAWMWDRKSSDNHLEIAMRDGEVVRAVRYSPKLSSGEYGVFAEKGDDDSYTIHTVAWAAVTRVALRNVKDLPERYFE